MNSKIDPNAFELLWKSLHTGAGLLGLVQHLHGAGFRLEILPSGPVAVSDVKKLRYADLDLLPYFEAMLRRDDHTTARCKDGSLAWQLMRCRVRWIESSSFTDPALRLTELFDFCLKASKLELVEEAIRVTWATAPCSDCNQRYWLLLDSLGRMLTAYRKAEVNKPAPRPKPRKPKRPSRRYRRRQRSYEAAGFARPEDLLRAEILQRLRRTA